MPDAEQDRCLLVNDVRESTEGDTTVTTDLPLFFRVFHYVGVKLQ